MCAHVDGDEQITEVVVHVGNRHTRVPRVQKVLDAGQCYHGYQVTVEPSNGRGVCLIHQHIIVTSQALYNKNLK